MKLALRVILTMGALAALFWLVPLDQVLAALRGLDPVWMGAGVLALTVQTLLSGVRWQITAQALGMRVPLFWAIREYALSMAANTFLPGGVLGDLGRIARTRRHGWGNAAASVVIERLAGQVALAGAIWLGLFLWLGAIWAILAGAALLLAVWGGARALPKAAALARTAWLGRGVRGPQIVLSVLILALNLLGFWAASRATGLALDPGAAFVVIPLTLLAMLVPLTLNGWGLREGLAALLWPVFGIAPADAVAASIAFGLACMGAALLGALVQVWPAADRAQT